MVDDILNQIDEARQLLIDSQETLLEFCRDTKADSLEKRFHVWKHYVTKEKHPWVIHESDVPIVGKMVDDQWPYEYDRHRTYDWDWFLDHHSHAVNYAEDPWCSITHDEFKELLMRENFGSFVFDW